MKNLTMHAVVFPILFVLAFTAPRLIVAGELNPAHVPAEAKWVLHVDFENLCDSKLAEAYREKKPEKVERLRQKSRERYGIDPQEDLKGLTLFSESHEPHSGAAILLASYDRAKVESFLIAKREVKTSKWNDHTLYTWKVHKDVKKYHDRSHRSKSHAKKDSHDGKDNKTITAILVDDKTIVFAGSKKRAKATVKMLKGDSESLKGKDTRLIADVRDGAFLYGAAIDLENLKGHQWPFPILRQHEFAKLTVGEHESKLFKNITLKAKDDNTAGQMKKALEGLIAISKVMTAEVESLNKLYDDAEISRDGVTVKAKWQGHTEEVVEAVEEACEQIKQHRKERKQRGGERSEQGEDV